MSIYMDIYAAATPEKQQEVIEDLIHLNYPKTYSFETKIPFGHLFQIWADYAEKKLQKKIDYGDLLSSHAQKQMKEKLIQQMAEQGSPTLAALLQVAKQEGKLQGKTPQDRYFFYLEKILTHPNYLKDFFSHFLPLAQIFSIQILLWIDQSQEFLTRFAQDKKELKRIFEIGEKIETLSPSLSDLHYGNRSVMCLQFRSAPSLIYKPKPLGLDKAYNAFLEALNGLGLEPKLKTIRILDKGSYGWEEFVSSFSCQREEEVKRYFQRIGILICLMFLLEGTDCHYENLLAFGEDPILIDLESLFHPTFNLPTPELLVWSQSVFRTGFLPGSRIFAQKQMDVSPLTAEEEQESWNQVVEWQEIHTDQMRMMLVNKKIKTSIPRPRLGNQLISTASYIDDLLAGFKKLYELASEHKKEILALLQPLFQFPVRCIVRPTLLYSQIQKRLTDPQLMRSEEKFAQTLEILTRYSKLKGTPHLEKIVEEEKRQLKHGDIPFFVSFPFDTNLYVENRVIAKECFKEPTEKQILNRIEHLNDQDLKRQLEYIEHSLYFLKASPQEEKILYYPYDFQGKVQPLNSQELLKAAEQIGQKIVELAQPLTDGSLSWVHLDFEPQTGRYTFHPLSKNLYSGDLGIALFFASLGTPSLVKRAEEILERIIQSFHRDPETNLLGLPLGGMVGLGGIIYSFASIGKILQKDKYIQIARHLATSVDPKRIREDAQYDLILGAAGFLLAILSLYEQIKDPSLLETADIAGDHLLDKADSVQGGYAWGKHLCGFSHGTAGIAYSLFKLSALTEKIRYSEAAKKALSYERNLFSPKHRNWPDFTQPKALFSSVSWCHGASGIGLGRFYISKYFSDEIIEKEIEIAKNTTLKYGIGNLDHLCCGNFGRIVFLWTLDSQNEAALGWTAQLIHSFQQRGVFQLFNNLPEKVQSPFFMRGLSGIGYTLLQMSKKKHLPQVLVLG